jgi:DNA-binding MarR family transcriptional regulator
LLDRARLLEELIESTHAIRHKIVMDSGYITGGRVSLSQLVVLRIVSKNSGVSIKEISGKLGITSSAVTQLVDGLVSKGYLNREGSREDRRALKLTLSGPGRGVIQTVRDNGLKELLHIFSALDDAEFEKYCELNRKIVANMLRQPPPDEAAGRGLAEKRADHDH